jgi:hypothetical protein
LLNKASGDEEELENEENRESENHQPQFQWNREDFPRNQDRWGVGY